MEGGNGYVRDGFIRQRRNLMIMSVVVLVQEIAGLQYKVISALGNEATVNNEFVLRLLVFLMFGYWLIRYFQYMGDLSDNEFSKAFERKWFENIKTTNEYKDKLKELNDSLPDPENIHLSRLGRFSIQFQYVHDEDDDIPNGATTHLYTFPGAYSFYTALLTALSLCTTTRYFTEYYFPYVLALMAILSVFIEL